MPDQTIDHLLASLKDLNARLEKLGRAVDRLDILTYRYQRLSACYKELHEALDQIDVVAFEIRQDFTLLRETYKCVNLTTY